MSAQNAYYQRPLTDPIASDDRVTGRYQAIVGPWTHGEHVNEATLQGIRLEWFDTWLKNAPTGMANTSTPLHLFENGANTWVDSAAWPLSSDARTYYLGNGSLTPGEPTDEGSDTLSWSTATTADTLTYTTAPLTKAALLNGPTDVTLYARSTTPETELSAKLSIVAPDGTTTKQADGILLGSRRALDTQESWYGANGTLLKPSHPFTQASQRPVTPGRTTRYDISLLSNFTRIPAGYRIGSASTASPGRLPLPRRTDPAGTGEPGRWHLHRRTLPAGGVLRQPASDDAEFGHAQRHRLGTVLLNHEGARHGWQVCAYGRPATPVSRRA